MAELNRISGCWEKNPTSTTALCGRGFGIDDFKSLLEQWFVLYNPLYFLSMALILAGVWILSIGLPETGLSDGELGLFAVVQAYEALLIGSAALLFRAANRKRPAVILGLMEVFFLFDWTFRTESLCAFGATGILCSVAWLILVPVKIGLLLHIFRIRIRAVFLIFPALSSLVLASMPHVFIIFHFNQTVLHLGATWLIAIFCVIVRIVGPTPVAEFSEGLRENVVLRRAGATFWCALGGIFALHLGAWLVEFQIPLTPSHFVPLLLALPALFALENEIWGWVSCAAAMALAFTAPVTVAPVSVMTAAAAVFWAVRNRKLRLYTAALAVLYIGAICLVRQHAPGESPMLAVTFAASAMAVGLAALRRTVTAGIFAAAVWSPFLRVLNPESAAHWGVLLLSCGFAALIAGVCINLFFFGKKTGRDEPGGGPA